MDQIRRRVRMAGRGIAVAALAAALPAQAPGEDEALNLKALEALFNTQVIVASKKAQRISEAPAVISLITSQDIAERGYRSVAEALQDVPGLYAVNDFLTPNVGVRGINGGLRAYNRILKVMIDGQPVAFRPDSTNFLGPELLPISVVERIEVVRGPASALYGADAFLGVVNILTRSAEPEGPSGALLVRGSLSGDSLGGGEGWLRLGGEKGGLLLAASGYGLDRSGYALPSSSPYRLTHAGEDLVSRGDKASPRSYLLKGRVQVAEGLSLELLGHGSRLDRHAEFLDFGTLAPASRVDLDNGFYRAKAEWELAERTTLTGLFALARGGPAADERLSSGSASSYPRRQLDYRDTELGLEARRDFRDEDTLILGVDRGRDDEQLMNVYSVDSATGASTPTGEVQGRRTFGTTGLYAQYVVYPVARAGITLNLRRDQHDVYGAKTTYRVGSVVRLGPTLSAKLLVGTSYKAPAPWQLYAQPLYAGEVVGNGRLEPETARTWEAEVAWYPSPSFAMTVNGFQNRIRDKVELEPLGINQVPRNTAEQASYGFEGQARYLRRRDAFILGLSYQKSEDRQRDPFRGTVAVPTSSYPAFMGSLRWESRLPAGGQLSLVERYVSPRRATASNIQENLLRPYSLPAYAVLDAALNLQGRWGRRDWKLNLRGDNLLDRRTADSGFAGVDLPGPRRQVVLSLGLGF